MDEPVDVYSGWIDACEEVNKQKKLQAIKQRGPSSRDDSRSPPPQSRLDPFDEDDDDDY